MWISGRGHESSVIRKLFVNKFLEGKLKVNNRYLTSLLYTSTYTLLVVIITFPLILIRGVTLDLGPVEKVNNKGFYILFTYTYLKGFDSSTLVQEPSWSYRCLLRDKVIPGGTEGPLSLDHLRPTSHVTVKIVDSLLSPFCLQFSRGRL